jgi:hypothetical protein
MIAGTYRDLFAAIAACAASLTGLLFVAISVAPRLRSSSERPVIYQVRSSASLIAFTNALAIALFGLVPGNNVGWPALALGISGVFFSAASIRSIAATHPTRYGLVRQLGLIVLLLVVFGFEIFAGIVMIRHPDLRWPLDTISNLLVASLLIGIARAWELVGDRDTGIISSIALLAGRNPDFGVRAANDEPLAPAPGTPTDREA